MTTAAAALSAKHILSMEDLTPEDVELIMNTAKSFSAVNERVIKKVPTLRGRTVINLFFEPSTRTRTSFELAGKRLSADVINISASASATTKGESLKDTAQTLSAYNADAIVIRHSRAGSAAMLSRYIDGRVINAGDGCHEHPTQALLDLYTIRESIGELAGKRVVILGDILHSRVARSNLIAFKMMGARVAVAGPPTLMPRGIESLADEVHYELAPAIAEADLIYLLRVQSERQKGCFFPNAREYSRLFGLNREALSQAPAGCRVMHPGPINRGVEISADVADDPSVLILNQVNSGIHVRMACLFLLLSGADGEVPEV